MIRLQGLRKNYGAVEALRGVTLEVAEGELFAYLGPNGSGKTTTIRILTGLAVPTAGDAFVDGRHVVRETLLARRRCGLVPQHVNLDAELTLRENLDIHGRLFGMPRSERARRTEELFSAFELTEKADHLAKTLSGGLKRRLMIARALMHGPRVLFLDEPTVGLDPAIRRRIWSLVKRIQQDGATVFLTTHYIEEAEFLADRVAFLDRGELVALDTPGGLMRRLGEWALDDLVNGEMTTAYFRTREEADAHVRGGRPGAFTLRRVNLEDAFIGATGRRVAP